MSEPAAAPRMSVHASLSQELDRRRDVRLRVRHALPQLRQARLERRHARLAVLEPLGPAFAQAADSAVEQELALAERLGGRIQRFECRVGHVALLRQAAELTTQLLGLARVLGDRAQQVEQRIEELAQLGLEVRGRLFEHGFEGSVLKARERELDLGLNAVDRCQQGTCFRLPPLPQYVERGLGELVELAKLLLQKLESFEASRQILGSLCRRVR